METSLPRGPFGRSSRCVLYRAAWATLATGSDELIQPVIRERCLVPAHLLDFIDLRVACLNETGIETAARRHVE